MFAEKRHAPREENDSIFPTRSRIPHSTGGRNWQNRTFEREMGAVFREIGLFYYIRKRARPFGKAGSIPPRVPLSAQPSRASGSGSY